MPTPPNFGRKVWNYGVAMLKRAVAEVKDVPPEVRAYRLSICEKCEHLSKQRECLICGCPVDEKAGWATEKCPIDKWPSVNAKPPPEPPRGCGCRAG